VDDQSANLENLARIIYELTLTSSEETHNDPDMKTKVIAGDDEESETSDGNPTDYEDIPAGFKVTSSCQFLVRLIENSLLPFEGVGLAED
jgi:hypothetical protein